MPTTHGRNTANHQRLVASLRARRLPCWLCGQAIDYAAPADDPSSFNADHVEPLSKRPDLAEIESNLRPAHRRCNTGRGNRAPKLDLGQPSRRW